VRYFVAAALLTAATSVLPADIYGCKDANGNWRFTNTESESSDCKLKPISTTESLPRAERERTAPATRSSKGEFAGLTSAQAGPDPTARLDALEAWARGARETLDPVTHALVDPDESVRARAQELWESVLNAKTGREDSNQLHRSAR
jgi:hypothetical protein